MFVWDDLAVRERVPSSPVEPGDVGSVGVADGRRRPLIEGFLGTSRPTTDRRSTGSSSSGS